MEDQHFFVVHVKINSAVNQLVLIKAWQFTKKNLIDMKNLKGVIMANHASAKKRSRQNKVRNTVNSQYLSKFRTALNKFKSSVEEKNDHEIQKSFSAVNSIMAKALKRGIFKKEYISRKLSSLSKQISKK